MGASRSCCSPWSPDRRRSPERGWLKREDPTRQGCRLTDGYFLKARAFHWPALGCISQRATNCPAGLEMQPTAAARSSSDRANRAGGDPARRTTVSPGAVRRVKPGFLKPGLLRLLRDQNGLPVKRVDTPRCLLRTHGGYRRGPGERPNPHSHSRVRDRACERALRARFGPR
ncbi:uncharacterized protein LOC143482655 [Brachyhypopomus gauderio]|uniref:uncharacterized protein LOC143482655 n=1 Tax=Brachyhypopomus gauderio TaxID=698409 RepID=UPI0040428811